MSITSGARVELKGVQELELMEEYVKREVERIWNKERFDSNAFFLQWRNRLQ